MRLRAWARHLRRDGSQKSMYPGAASPTHPVAEVSVRTLCARRDPGRALRRGGLSNLDFTPRTCRDIPGFRVTFLESETRELESRRLRDGQRFAQGPHDHHHHGTTRSFPRRRCIKAARRFFSFLSRLRTPVLSGARSRLFPAPRSLRGPLWRRLVSPARIS